MSDEDEEEINISKDIETIIKSVSYNLIILEIL